MSELPFFYEAANKRFWVKGGAQGYTPEELKAGLSEWAGMVDEIVKAAESPAEPESPAAAEPLPTP